MDDIQIGRGLRRIRLERRLTQAAAAEAAGVSRPLYSRIERGGLGRVDVDAVRRVAVALGARLDLQIQYRGGDLGRLLSSRHAAMGEAVVRRLLHVGWDVRPEVSYSHFGERGVVDLVARDPSGEALLLIELKTEVVDVNDILAQDGRRRRLAGVIARDLGWTFDHVSTWLVLAEGGSNRRAVSRFASLLRQAFPGGAVEARSWLVRPTRPLSALWFLPTVNVVSRSEGPRPSAASARARRDRP